MTKEKNKTNDGKATQKVASEKSETKTKGKTKVKKTGKGIKNKK